MRGELNTKNIAVGIKSIQYTRKQNNSATSVAQLARAAVSKTAGWGFESLLTCNHLEQTIKTELWIER